MSLKVGFQYVLAGLSLVGKMGLACCGSLVDFVGFLVPVAFQYVVPVAVGCVVIMVIMRELRKKILRMQMSEDGGREFAGKRKEEMMMMKILGGVDAIMGCRRFS